MDITQKCKKCIAYANFNGGNCYFANNPKDCNLTNRQIKYKIKQNEEEQEKYYESYGG